MPATTDAPPVFDVDAVKPQDEVGVDDPRWPGVWIVRKVNPVNLLLNRKGAAPGERGLKCPRHMIIAPPAEAEAAPGQSYPLIGQPFQPWVFWNAGAVARYTGRNPKLAKGLSLYVVITDKRDLVAIAVLGGDGYVWGKVPKSHLEIVPVADLAAALAAGPH